MLIHAGLAEPGTPKLDAKHEWIWALLGFSALAVFWTWPVAANLSSRIPHDAGDPVLNIWILVERAGHPAHRRTGTRR